MKQRLKAERDCSAKERLFQRYDARKDAVNRFHESMSVGVRLMSSKIPLDNRVPLVEAEHARYNLNQKLVELQSKQHELLRTHFLKEQMEDRRVLKCVKGGVQGRINEAVENLTMFSKECSVDVEEMQLQLMQATNAARQRQRTVQE